MMGKPLYKQRGIFSSYSCDQIIDIKCYFFYNFHSQSQGDLTVLPQQFKIFAQMPKMSSWKVAHVVK